MKMKNSNTNLFTKGKAILSSAGSRIARLPKRILWAASIALILLISAAGYFIWRQSSTSTTTAAKTLNTAVVRQGDISITAAGTGTLVANLTNNLSFPTTGYVGEVNVRIGDKVKKDQELAKLMDITTLQTAVVTAQQDLVTAQKDLDTLKTSAPSTLANAQLTVADDKKALKDAQSALILPGMIRCDQKQTDAYYNTYLLRKDQLDALGDPQPNPGGNSQYYLEVVVPAKNLVAQAYAAYKYCAGFTEYELDASRAKLEIAKAKLAQDQATLDLLTQNKGLDPDSVATAQNKVDNAQVALDSAKANLAGATIKAPFDGTITDVAGQVGDKVESGSFITIVDDTHPLIQFVIDETDLSKLALDETAEVTFDAIENRTFTGKVGLINPSLQTTNGYSTIQGLIQLDLPTDGNLPVMLQGMTATVNIIQGRSQNTLLVPIQAVRQIGDGQYGVYVVDANENLKLRIVTVGLMDSVNAEIKSGLKAGETVSTGLSETK
jgi:HlyD family secretion protein